MGKLIYNSIPLICFCCLLILGLVMVIFPKPLTNKDDREDAKVVAKTRKVGVFFAIVSTIYIIFEIVTTYVI